MISLAQLNPKPKQDRRTEDRSDVTRPRPRRKGLPGIAPQEVRYATARERSDDAQSNGAD